jgi:hypothetical protein
LIMAECTVIGVDLFSFNGKAIYTAISDYFDVVPLGYKIPFYVWHLISELDENGQRKTRIKGCEKIEGTIY